jgi:alanyl-tRNA synthetase
MRQFTSDELRKTWKQFYMDRGHVDVGAVSLVSDGSTGVMFTYFCLHNLAFLFIFLKYHAIL